MARRGRDQITVRLEDDILDELRTLAQTDRGRAGGLALYVRRLIYQDLGRPLPEQYGLEAEACWSPRLATRLEHWLETDPDEREELLEAARLLAGRLGLELTESGEAARLRKKAAEVERLRKEPAARPDRPTAPRLGSDYQQGRYAGLEQGARMAEELMGIHRERRGERAKGICQGLRTAANFCRTVMEEIQKGQEQALTVARARHGFRHSDPEYLRSTARQWQLVLRKDPEDRKAQEVLAELEALARAAGVEIPPLPPERPRSRRPNP